MTWHTDPTFRGLILRVAEGHAEEMSVLADWLEEHGDARAVGVRRVCLGREVEGLHPYAAPISRSRRALGFFPEGPRWRARQRADLPGRPGVVEDRLTPASAKADAEGRVGGLSGQWFVEGPIWPEPPNANGGYADGATGNPDTGNDNGTDPAPPADAVAAADGAAD